VIDDSGSCVAKSGACVVSKRHHPNILYIPREEVSEPKGICLAMGPSSGWISVKSMDSYKTIDEDVGRLYSSNNGKGETFNRT
jgi:hypothetical protein